MPDQSDPIRTALTRVVRAFYESEAATNVATKLTTEQCVALFEAKRALSETTTLKFCMPVSMLGELMCARCTRIIFKHPQECNE